MSTQAITDNPLLAARVTVPRHVVYRSFPAETVLLNLDTGTYHGLNPSGGQMLAALERAASVGAAAGELASSYGQPLALITRDLCELCEGLRARGLIEFDGLAEG
jgi:hypothetical protein